MPRTIKNDTEIIRHLHIRRRQKNNSCLKKQCRKILNDIDIGAKLLLFLHTMMLGKQQSINILHRTDA